MKKSQLREIIREEILNIVEAMKQPSDKTSKKYPEILQYDIDRRGSDLFWTIISTEKWDRNKASTFQWDEGYAPMGYGGPNRFMAQQLPDGNFKYTWTCSSSSD